MIAKANSKNVSPSLGLIFSFARARASWYDSCRCSNEKGLFRFAYNWLLCKTAVKFVEFSSEIDDLIQKQNEYHQCKRGEGRPPITRRGGENGQQNSSSNRLARVRAKGFHRSRPRGRSPRRGTGSLFCRFGAQDSAIIFACNRSFFRLGSHSAKEGCLNFL